MKTTKNTLLIVGLIVGLIFGYLAGLKVSKAANKTTETTDSRVAQPSGGWKSSSLHFAFEYPNGWHVHATADTFYLDEQPIYFFSHQPPTLVEGKNIEDTEKVT